MSDGAALPIDWISIAGYWDGPLSGWIRVQGKRYWFDYSENEDDPDAIRVYTVFEIPRDERLAAMKRLRLWRQLVGWHMDRKPGKPRTYFDAEAHPHYRDYYEIPRLPKFSQKTRVGTTDLVVMRPDDNAGATS